MSSIINVCRLGAVALAVLATAACAPTSYAVKTPQPSSWQYQADGAPAHSELTLKDARQGDARVFHSGILPATLTVDKTPIDAPSFLATHVQDELVARGLPVHISKTETVPAKIELHSFHVENARTSGFSPFITFTSISADLDTPQGKKRIGAFIKRGKVPVWSFDEVIEPTFNQPLSLAVKEFASKIANHLYGYRADDATVDQLVQKLSGKRNDDSYLDVYALGFTNNPKAIPTLVTLSGDKDEYVRLAAISSLGNIGAQEQLSHLKSLYQNRSNIWQDRAMALKAIGDLGSAESTSFLTQERQFWESKGTDKEAVWTLQIIGTYL